MIRAGAFDGVDYFDWSAGHESFRVLLPLAFIDHRGMRWEVPAGFMVDRSRIPAFLHRWVGDPFCRRMRRATALHCFYSWQRGVGSGRVHRMFAEAALTDGVPRRQWVLTYWGLILFGDHWGVG